VGKTGLTGTINLKGQQGEMVADKKINLRANYQQEKMKK